MLFLNFTASHKFQHICNTFQCFIYIYIYIYISRTFMPENGHIIVVFYSKYKLSLISCCALATVLETWFSEEFVI